LAADPALETEVEIPDTNKAKARAPNLEPLDLISVSLPFSKSLRKPDSWTRSCVGREGKHHVELSFRISGQLRLHRQGQRQWFSRESFTWG
jgi:hypothetical protein